MSTAAPKVSRALPSAPLQVRGLRVRITGIALLIVCGVAFFAETRLVTVAPQHQPTVLEMLVSLVAVLAGCSGAMATFVGPALFEPYVWPPRDAE